MAGLVAEREAATRTVEINTKYYLNEVLKIVYLNFDVPEWIIVRLQLRMNRAEQDTFYEAIMDECVIVNWELISVPDDVPETVTLMVDLTTSGLHSYSRLIDLLRTFSGVVEYQSFLSAMDTVFLCFH